MPEEQAEEQELEEFIEEWDKQITQEDKIDESVEEYMGEMGWLWTTVIKKLEDDKFCFKCKQNVDFNKNEPPHVVQASKTDAGVVAFVSLCNKCYKEEQQKVEELEKQKQVENNE